MNKTIHARKCRTGVPAGLAGERAWFRPPLTRLALALLLAAAGCSRQPDPGRQVKTGMEFAKRTFEHVQRDPAAAAAFAAALQTGGSALDYLTASIGDPAGLPPFARGQPVDPYTVVVGYDAEQGCFVIEGYTASLAKPAMVEKVLYRLPGPPPPAPPTNAAPAPDRTELNNALLEASLSGATGTVAALLTQGADVNARSSEGGTPLMYACASGHVQTVQLLLAAGADVQARASDPNAWPVIMVAAQNGAPEIMKLLLEKGADPNTVDPSRNTPLMLAALRGHAQVVELLIRAGANLNAQETKRRNFPLLYAVSRGHAAIAEVLICNGAKVNLCDQSGMTALMSCAENGNTEIAASLLKTNANLEAKLTGEVGAGATALMLAAAKGQEGMVRLLLTNGANAKATDKNGFTAQRYAVHNNHAALAQLLEAAEQGAAPKPPPAIKPTVQPKPPIGATNLVDLQALIGKNQKAADDLLGRPLGILKQNENTIIKYRNAEVILKNGIIIKAR